LTADSLSRSERAYRALLHLYPRDFRRRFGDDMCDLFRDRLRHDEQHPARLWLHVAPDLIGSAAHERMRALHDGLLKPRQHTPLLSRSGDSMLETIVNDVRLTLRMLRKTPAFTAVAILVIALGSGAVTTIFSAANALVLRPLPGVREPRDVVDIGRTTENGRGSLTPSYPFYRNIRDENRTFDGVAAWTILSLTVSTGAEGTTAFGNMVSGNYFNLLGVRPALGRFFSTEEDRTPGTHPVIVLSNGFWQRRFGGDSSVIGRTISVNGARYTIIGVTPLEFGGLMPIARVDAWVPIMMAAQLGQGDNALSSAGSGWLMLFGRFRDGVSVEQARTDLSAIAKAHIAEEPRDMGRYTGIAISRVTGFPADASGPIVGFVTILFVISLLVLIIASINVAGMLLARATARRREMAVRIALGASRRRIIRQLLTESVVLFLAGATAGTLLAIAGTRAFGRVELNVEVPLSVEFSPDYRVLLFALGCALLTGVIFGLAPALQATRADQSVSLRSDTPGGGMRRTRLRNALVIGQMAVSLLLLMSAGLFVRALGRAQRVEPGFDPGNVAIATIDVGTAGYNEARARVFYDELRARISGIPGVSAVSYAPMLPLTGSSSGTNFTVEGFTPPGSNASDNSVNFSFARVGPGYFDVIRMPLVAGRGFEAADRQDSPGVAVVNEGFAREFWPSGSAIGKTLRRDGTPITIVGVTRDAKYSSLNEEGRPFIYVPVSQDWSSRTNLLVRTSGDPLAFASAIREAVRTGDPLLPIPEVSTLHAATSVSLLPQRVAAGVTGAMGALGLLLAAVGLYGVVAYSASQRTREIGVRMALGADRGNVLRLIVREGMRLVVAGMGIGMVLAFGITRVMTGFLFGVSPIDPLVFAVIPVSLGAIALLASYLPARRAASASPLTALRGE
jgi:predicted permease